MCNHYVLKPKTNSKFFPRDLRMEDCCCHQRDSEIPKPAKLPGKDVWLSGAAVRISRVLLYLLPGLERWAGIGGLCAFSSHHADGGRDYGLRHPACSPRLMQLGSKACVPYRARYKMLIKSPLFHCLSWCLITQ